MCVAKYITESVNYKILISLHFWRDFLKTLIFQGLKEFFVFLAFSRFFHINNNLAHYHSVSVRMVAVYRRKVFYSYTRHFYTDIYLVSLNKNASTIKLRQNWFDKKSNYLRPSSRPLGFVGADEFEACVVCSAGDEIFSLACSAILCFAR